MSKTEEQFDHLRSPSGSRSRGGTARNRISGACRALFRLEPLKSISIAAPAMTRTGCARVVRRVGQLGPGWVVDRDERDVRGTRRPRSLIACNADTHQVVGDKQRSYTSTEELLRRLHAPLEPEVALGDPRPEAGGRDGLVKAQEPFVRGLDP